MNLVHNKIPAELFSTKTIKWNTLDSAQRKKHSKAILKAYENYDLARGGIFDVGTSEPRTFKSGLEILGIAYVHSGEEAKPTGYQEYTCADPKKRVPGWSPEFLLEKGLSDYRATLQSLRIPS